MWYKCQTANAVFSDSFWIPTQTFTIGNCRLSEPGTSAGSNAIDCRSSMTIGGFDSDPLHAWLRETVRKIFRTAPH